MMEGGEQSVYCASFEQSVHHNNYSMLQSKCTHCFDEPSLTNIMIQCCLFICCNLIRKYNIIDIYIYSSRGNSSISHMPGCGPNALPKNWI